MPRFALGTKILFSRNLLSSPFIVPKSILLPKFGPREDAFHVRVKAGLEIALCKWWLCITPWKFFLENDRQLQLWSEALDGLCECCQSAENSKGQDKDLAGRQGSNHITHQFSTKWEFLKYKWCIINFQLKDYANTQENRGSNKNYFTLQTIKATKHRSSLSLLPQAPKGSTLLAELCGFSPHCLNPTQPNAAQHLLAALTIQNHKSSSVLTLTLTWKAT